jgi:hypothetical protein
MIKVIEDSEWGEVEPDCDGDVFGMQEFYTLDELKKAVEMELGSMCENEQHMRSVHGDPTYLQWVLSSVSRKIQPGQKVEVDELNHRYRIIEELD